MTQEDLEGRLSHEQAMVVSLAVRMALTLGLPAGMAFDPLQEPDWRFVASIDLPSGQVSWLIHEREMELFHDVPIYGKPHDGHTAQDQWERLLAPDLGTSPVGRLTSGLCDLLHLI